jgi:hypothetical protein
MRIAQSTATSNCKAAAAAGGGGGGVGGGEGVIANICSYLLEKFHKMASFHVQQLPVGV